MMASEALIKLSAYGEPKSFEPRHLEGRFLEARPYSKHMERFRGLEERFRGRMSPNTEADWAKIRRIRSVVKKMKQAKERLDANPTRKGLDMYVKRGKVIINSVGKYVDRYPALDNIFHFLKNK